MQFALMFKLKINISITHKKIRYPISRITVCNKVFHTYGRSEVHCLYYSKNNLSRLWSSFGCFPEGSRLPRLRDSLKNCFRLDIPVHGHLLLLQIDVKGFNTCLTWVNTSKLLHQQTEATQSHNKTYSIITLISKSDEWRSLQRAFITTKSYLNPPFSFHKMYS